MPAAWKTFAALAALAALGPAPTFAADPPAVVLPLTPFEVLGLVQQGIGDEAVIAKLRETRSTFRLSAGDVQMLKALGVSNRVLAAMTAPLPLEAAPAPRSLPPVVQAAAIVPAPAATHVGAWVREFDGLQVVLRFTDKRMFVTLNVAHVEEDKPGEQRMTYRADADYAVGPDGTLFGVVTGTDFTPPKGEDATRGLKSVAELIGMPFCGRFRIDDGVLSVSDLRGEHLGDKSDVAVVLGRYTRAEKEPAPPKAVKVPKDCNGPQCRPATGATLGAGIGAATRYATDPKIRMDQLLNQTGGNGPIGEPAPAQPETAPMPRPVPMTPERLHGGIIG